MNNNWFINSTEKGFCIILMLDFLAFSISIGLKNSQSKIILPCLLATIANISKQQNMQEQFLRCKNTAKEQYLLAKEFDSHIYDKMIEDFIK